MTCANEPFLHPIPKRWIPLEMKIAPALDPVVQAGPLETNYALLINPFYHKDANASFGKHVLTPTLGLPSCAATAQAYWSVESWDQNLLDGRTPAHPMPYV